MKPKEYVDNTAVPSIGRYRFPTSSITTTIASFIRHEFIRRNPADAVKAQGCNILQTFYTYRL